MRTVRIILAITCAVFAVLFVFTAATTTSTDALIGGIVLTVAFATGAWFAFPKKPAGREDNRTTSPVG